MIFNGIIKSKNRADRSQYICPKRTTKMINGVKQVNLDCKNPCTSSPYGRIKNITTHHSYRFFSAMPRSSEKWIGLYKHRPVSERTINQIKSFISIESTKVRNTLTLQANVFLAGISQMIAFIILFNSKYAKGSLAIRTLIS